MTPKSALLTAELEQIARSAVPPDVIRPSDLIVALVCRDERIAPTLISAWRRDGHELTPIMEGILRSAAARIARYEVVLAHLRQRQLQFEALKGASTAMFYPTGIVREMHDVDLLAADMDALWEIALAIEAIGFQTDALTLMLVDGTLHGALGARRQDNDLDRPDRVEVLTLPSFGSLARPARAFPRATSDPEKVLLLLLEERLQRAFIARDLVDATVALRAPELDLHRLWTSIDAFDAWAEWAELIERLDKAGVRSSPYLPPNLRQRRMRSTRRQARRLATQIRHPAAFGVRLGQQLLINRTMSRSRRWLWTRFRSVLDVEGAWLRAMPLFGLVIDRERRAFGIHQQAGARVAIADTPVGRFALTTGDEVDEDELRSIERTVAGRRGLVS